MKHSIICLLTLLIAEFSHSQTLLYNKEGNLAYPPHEQGILSSFYQSFTSSLNKINSNRLNSNYLLRLDSIITYTPSGQIHSLYQWIYSDDIIPSERILFNYKDGQTRTPAGKRSKIYDHDKILNTEYYMEWLPDQQKWDTLTKEVYYYNNTGELMKVQSHLAPDWYFYLQREFTYNSSGAPASETIYKKPDSEPAFRIEYTYQNSLLNKENTYEWSSNGWIHIHQILYTYDDYENPVEQLFSHREQYASNELIPYKKTLLKYDLSVIKDLLITDINFPFSHKLTAMTDLEYQKSTDQWILTRTSIPYYSEVNNPVTDLQTISQNLSFDMYPNPFDNNITIVMNGYTPTLLEVFNSLGTKIISTFTYNQQIFPTEQLPAGSYICVLHTENGKFFKRLIKRN